MEIQIKGKVLTQAQLDAIVPVINKNMGSPMGRKKFEAACLKAMEDAGCPLEPEGAKEQ